MLSKIMESNPISFTNVRHPFERLVSGYLDAVPGGKFKAFRGQTFDQFVKDTVLREANASRSKKTYFQMNEHWRPANAYCGFCNIHYRVISKTETFNEDKERILDMVGIKQDKKNQRLHTHGGDKIKTITRNYMKNMSRDLRIAVVDLYRHDFAMFDYDPEYY